MGVTWAAALALAARAGPLLRGWPLARLVQDAAALGWAGAVAASLLARVRSGFWPLQWALLPALADVAAHALRVKGGPEHVPPRRPPARRPDHPPPQMARVPAPGRWARWCRCCRRATWRWAACACSCR